MEQPKKNFKLVSDKKTRVILQNILTLIGVCIGLSSIKFALDSKYEIAIIAIIFCSTNRRIRWSNSKINKRNI